MAYEFKKLSEVESVDEFPEGAKVLIENNGNINRCAADGLGGGGGYHWIHLDVDVESQEISCDEEITFDSLKADISNGLMPACILEVEGEAYMTYIGSLSVIAIDGDGGQAMFSLGTSGAVVLQSGDGENYSWSFGG